ncbi:MAG: zinc-dependent peptidase [bacterium]|nr:zinc-dependent peptidase [bacterium]
MFFFRGRKRRKLLETPLDANQRALMHRTAPLTAVLPPAYVPRHEGAVQVLLEEKSWEGAGELDLTPEMRMAVAGQAALLQLRQDADHYPGLDTVLVYPNAFVVDHEVMDEDGLVHGGEDELAGESWQRGVVILSWQDVTDEARRRDGYNVVLHEFAHQLDEEAGAADGAPLLATGDLQSRWADAFGSAYERHTKLLRRRREVLFDDNAAENPAEFFATAVEVFFEFPRDLAREYPAVHAVLAEYLGLDPAAWRFD